jgi:gas vesicle protein
VSDSRGSDLVVVFGAGVILGAVAGLLLAPQSGAETRRQIGEAAEGALDKGRELAGGTADKGRELMSTTAEKGREGARVAGEFIHDQKERIGEALREGKDAYLREASKKA